MAALTGATALRGQERASTQAAEKDHSSSDPGQENKPLLDENPDSNMPPPTDHGDMVPLRLRSGEPRQDSRRKARNRVVPAVLMFGPVAGTRTR